MLLRRSSQFLRSSYGCFSTVAEPKARLEEFRTSELNPSNHTSEHIGKYYSIDEDTKNKLFRFGGLPKTFQKQVKTFNEACLMVRNPAVEIINYIKNTDFNKPIIRYVLYGDNGTGKSMTMGHLLHYGIENDFLLVHVPWVPYWFKHPKEICVPNIQQKMFYNADGFVDLPLEAGKWLTHFKHQNADLLTKLAVCTTKEYVWSKRETTEVGATLLELIDHGINRAKYASEVIKVLLDEIKQQSSDGKFKTMVVIDGYSALFSEETNMRAEYRVMVPTSKITLTKPFIDLTHHDWNNGLCVLSVDKLGMKGWVRESHLPMYLLKREGFEHLDPFVPIKQDNYDDKEYESCIAYYTNRRWIQNVEEGFDQELKFLSDKNPYKLMDLCKSL